MISLKAFAKVNLSLYVTGIRDDGYHLLDTVMQSVSLYDTVEVQKRNDGKINVTSDNCLLCGENNICYKAAKLFFQRTGIEAGADIHIIKRIPLAAGLGGGSADAAAVLRGLNAEFDLPLTVSPIMEIALKLGADVPFCINNGCARVKGIGEEISPLKRTLPLYMLLIKEGEKPSTKEMYNELDRKMSDLPFSGNAEKLSQSLENGDYNGFLASLHNDFALLWDYSEIENNLIKAGADGVSLSGSGPTVIGFFDTYDKALDAFIFLKDKYTEGFLCEAN